MKFNELWNNMSIKLIDGSRLYISLIKKNIGNGKNFKIKPVNFSIENKEIAFCCELPFGILSFDIRLMIIISSIVEINEHKLLNIRSLDLMHVFMKLKIFDYFGFHKYLEETGFDIEFIDIHDEFVVYKTFEKYRNNLEPLKELKQLALLRGQEINEIKNETKIKSNLLNDEINDTLKYFDLKLRHGTLKNRCFKKLNSYEDKIK